MSRNAPNIKKRKPTCKLICGIFWRVVRADVELSRQVPFPHRRLVHIQELGAALHLGIVAAIVEDCARMTRCVYSPEPHGPNKARDHFAVLEHISRQLAHSS